MDKDTPVFRTLLTKEEYDALMAKYPCVGNTQTNYYFDTPSFSLKANDIIMRVKVKDNGFVSLAIKRKKSYSTEELKEPFSQEGFEKLLNEGVLTNDRAQLAINDVARGKKFQKYLDLSTYRCTFGYRGCTACLDKCTYLDRTDYELEFHSINYDEGKKEFIALMKEMNIEYKKCEIKIKRCYTALIDYI